VEKSKEIDKSKLDADVPISKNFVRKEPIVKPIESSP
jgi:hypothetical protein